MTIRERAVEVKQLPQLSNQQQRHLFFNEIERCLNIDRPRMVLDCSAMTRFDRTIVHLLLCCLESAIKHNGELKLAALSPEAGEFLGQAARLFDIYDTTAEAVDSFDRVPLVAAPPPFARAGSQNDAETPSEQR